MSPKKYYTFMIEPEMADALKLAKDAEPEMSEGAIIREALREWLERRSRSKRRSSAKSKK